MAENPRIEELRRRVLADPASIAFAALAEEFRRVGRYDEAVETCRTGLLRHPAYLSARVTLGRALIETGDLEAAREELETVLQSAPENLTAIRGLAQIHERLGQSSEMDPHLADMMKTMHAESIRVAALPPPEPPPAAFEPELVAFAPEPVAFASEPVAFEPEPEPEPVALAPEPEPELDFVPDPEPEFEPAPAAAITMSLEPNPAPKVESSTDPFAAFTPASNPVTKREPAYDFSLDLGMRSPALDLAIAPAADSLDLGPLEPEPVEPEPVEPEPVEPERVGPDPATLATLARLERFLDAIQSLRA